MTVRIPIPLGSLRTLLLLAVAWGGSVGIVLAFHYWVIDEGVGQGELSNYVTQSQLGNYATDAQLSSLQSELSASRSTTVSPRLQGVLGLLVLDAAARGSLRADVAKNQFFKTASSSDFDTCISWLSGKGAGEVAGREACGRVASSVDFGG